MNTEATICAIATGLSEAGVGIIRISGSKAIEIANKIFKTKKGNNINIQESHKVYYGFIYDAATPIDEVLLLVMKAPHSYTAEDVVEIQAHGGILILQNILNVVLKNGAVLAQPGEFTKKAFLNGRIDLAKAESVADFISSQNEFAMKANFKTLKGDLSTKIIEMKNDILEANAFIEAALDDPEHIEIEGFTENLRPKLISISEELNKLISSYNDGKIIKEGIKTVILGKPNAGKSSLLNCLMNEERAIVTNIAGTTRDTLKESINLNGFTLNIVDTAGIRNENVDVIEKIGIEKALNEAITSDLILYIIDCFELISNKNISNIDKQIFDFIYSNDKKFILILNKIDLLKNVSEEDIKENIENILKNNNYPFDNFILASINQNLGIEEIKNNITNLFFNNSINYNNELFITNERHKNLLIEANNYINNVISSIDNNLPEDFLSIDLIGSYNSLAELLGEEVNEDLINEIFSKFCMGK